MEDARDGVFNMARVCRFCLSQTGVMSEIFNNGSLMLPTLAAKIMAFSQIQLFVNDGLPSILCHRCLYMAEKAFDFKTRCEASDAMLRKYLSIMQSQMPSIKTENEALHTSQKFYVPSACKTSPITPAPEVVVKRKRGRPRKQENLIFYSSPTHPSTEPVTTVPPVDEIKIVDGIESVVTVVDPRTEILSNSDEEQKKESAESLDREKPDIDTMRSLAIARAKAKKYMGVVMRVDENGTKVRRHLCKGCGKTFGHCSDLRKHVLVHTGERPFHCQLCTKTFSRSTNLNKHLKVHSGQKPFSCSDCPKSFATKGDLQRHLVIHSGIKPFSCPLCQQCFSRKDKLTRHVKLHGEHVLGSINNDSCWTGHSIGVGEEEDGGEFDGARVKVEADDDGDSSDVADSETTSRMDEAETHDHVESMVINIDPFPLESSLLGGYTDKLNNEHASLKTTEDGLYAFSDSNSNLKMSSTERPHKCFICFKSFTRRRELLRHDSVHSGVKPHTCPICCKAFARKDKLARHKKTHEGVAKSGKALICSPCGLGFHNEVLYNEHVESHNRALANSLDADSDDEPCHRSGGESDDINSDDDPDDEKAIF